MQILHYQIINLATHLYRGTVWTVRVSGLPDGDVVPSVSPDPV